MSVCKFFSKVNCQAHHTNSKLSSSGLAPGPGRELFQNSKKRTITCAIIQMHHPPPTHNFSMLLKVPSVKNSTFYVLCLLSIVHATCYDVLCQKVSPLSHSGSAPPNPPWLNAQPFGSTLMEQLKLGSNDH